MRRLLSALMLALVLLCPVGSALGQAATVPVVVIDGAGFGHGVGMAQEGALAMGAAGATTEEILGQFYPGVGLGRARGPVRVPVLDIGAAPSAGVVSFPDGGEVREVGTGPGTPGFPVRVPPGGQVRVSFDGSRHRVEPIGTPATPRRSLRVRLVSSVRPQIPPLLPPLAPTTTTTTPTPATTTTEPGGSPPAGPDPAAPPADDEPAPPAGDEPAPPAGDAPAPVPSTPRPVVAVPPDGGTVALPQRQRRYRGVIEAAPGAGGLRFVNRIDVESYLKGMGEVRDPSWPPAALRAQAIAARTYALRAMAAGGELCDTQRCQVYLGAQAEYGAMNKAVDDSREQVLVYRRALISAVYSANGGGFSASRLEGFGVDDGDAPYLRAAPYPSHDPGRWSATVALSDVAARLGYGGTVTGVRVARTGPSGRALEVVLEGSDGPVPITGMAFAAALGLRSTLFSLRVDNGVAPAAPPPADVGLQGLPDGAAIAVETDPSAANTPAAAPPTTRPRPRIARSVMGTGEVPEEAAVFAAWIVVATAGAAAVRLRRGPRPSMPPPSPSAPPSAGGSP